LNRKAKFALALLVLTTALALADDWPQFRGPRRDGVWRETGLIEKFDGTEIKAVWRVPISNGYSSPTVANGRVYAMDRLVEPGEQERVLCFDEKSGKPLWAHAYPCVYKGIGYPDGPRASVTVYEGRAYSIGSTGHVHCLDATTGKLLWQHDGLAEYQARIPDWGVAADPFIDGDNVIIHFGGIGACVVAFDRKTGQERWRALSDPASYAAPLVINQAGQRVLVCWTADRVVGLDPQSGKLHWEQPFPRKMWPIGIATPVLSGERLFITSAIDGALMLRLPTDRLAAEKLWQRRGPTDRVTDALHSLIATPLFLGDHLYGIDANGELRCLDAKTGDRLWENLTASRQGKFANAHLVQNGDRTWIFNDLGQLVIAKLTSKGYEELSRAQLIKPTRGQLNERDGVCWSPPAFANRHVFARNDEELVCASLEVR